MHDRLFRAPQVIQVKMIFNRSEGQFDIPSARIEEYDVRKRQEMRIEHIGQIAIVPAMEPELDQAHGITGLVVLIGSQVDDRIEYPISLITDV